jgi:hypothetical protein
VDKKTVQQAATQTTGDRDDILHGGEDTGLAKVAMSLVVNARGRVCLIHDGPFEATPVWIKYLTGKRKIQLIYDNGTDRIIDYVMDEKMHKTLLNVGKLFLIRTEKGKPIEAFDTTLLKE